MAYDKKAQEKYKKKVLQFKIQYSLHDNDGKRLKAYLDHTGQTANAWIKEVVKKELDFLGWMTETEQIIDIDDDTTGTDLP